MKKTSGDRKESIRVIRMDETETIESELGDIKISKEHFERERSDSDSWRHIKGNFDSDDIIDKLHFSRIESLDFQQEAMYRPVIVEMEEGSGKVFFKEDEAAEEFYKRLKYRLNAWKQNYQ